MRCEVRSCRAKTPRAWSLGAALLVLLAAPAARAQDCFPECRAGFVCANGACVSASNCVVAFDVSVLIPALLATVTYH